MLLDFLRTVPGANGTERASTPPGSLGTSPPGQQRSFVGEFHAERFFNFYIEVHQCPSPGF
jgi:hypothetical protein